jgi:hypothetical protein
LPGNDDTQLESFQDCQSQVKKPEGKNLLESLNNDEEMYFTADMEVITTSSSQLPERKVESFRSLVESSNFKLNLLAASGNIDLIHTLRKVASCSICLEVFQNPVLLPACQHAFCYSCIIEAIKLKENCPICCRSAPSYHRFLTGDVDYFLAADPQLEDVLLCFKKLLEEYDRDEIIKEIKNHQLAQQAKRKEGKRDDAPRDDKRIMPGVTSGHSTLLIPLIPLSQQDHSLLDAVDNPPLSQLSPTSSQQGKVPEAKFPVGAMVTVLPRTWSGK